MTDTLSPERVAEIRALAEKATPEVLYVCESCADGAPESRGYASAAEIRLSPSGTRYCEFCYEQETDLPAPQWKDAPSVGDVTQAFDGLRSLLASHEALRAEVERLQDQLSVCRKAGEMLSGAIVSSEDQREAALDRIWDSINAHGGTFEADDLEGKGKCEMIDVALEIIEREGGIGEVGRRLLQTEVEAADE